MCSIFQDYGESEIIPFKIHQESNRIAVWGIFDGNPDFDLSGTSQIGYDTVAGKRPYFIATYTMNSELLWYQVFYSEAPIQLDVRVPTILIGPDLQTYVTGMFLNNYFDINNSLLHEASETWEGVYLHGFNQNGIPLFHYSLINEQQCGNPSAVRNPENDGIWWIGNFRGEMDLDPSTEVNLKTSNVSAMPNTVFPNEEAVYWIELDLDGTFEKANFLNSNPSLSFTQVKSNQSTDFYVVSGAVNNKNFDHDLGTGEYFKLDLSRPYISKYDGIRIPEALGQESTRSDEFTIFPNPASDFLSISGQNTFGSFNIYDGFGQTIRTGNWPIKLDILDLPSGIYYLDLIWDNNRSSHKIIKSN